MRKSLCVRRPLQTAEQGFTLVELLMALLIFGILSASAFSLLSQHQVIFNQQQNLSEVNIALRNAVAQMQLDVANAGANLYTGVNIPNYPVGVVITNNVVASGGDCRTGTPLVYSTNCFDSFTIITADSATPPTDPTNGAGGCALTTSTTIYLTPAGLTTYASAAAATSAAASYLNGDQVLFVSNQGTTYTTAKLTAAGGTATLSGKYFVTLSIGATAANGTNTVASGNDPYGMTTNLNSMLGDQFCSTDFVLRLKPITYSVNLSTPANPTLIRVVAGSSQTLAQETLATQIIGFKVGASLFNNSLDTDTTIYCFDASKYDPNCLSPGTPPAWAYNFTLIRSMMVSIIGRTSPSTDPTYVFRNTFDGGAYEIQGVSAVINPRNMSMDD